MRFCWIKQHKEQYPVSVMCQLLEVSRSGYYDWAGGREPGKRQQRIELTREECRQRGWLGMCWDPKE